MFDRFNDNHPYTNGGIVNPGSKDDVIWCGYDGLFPEEEDLAVLVAARNALPHLIARIRELEAQLAN